MTDTFWFSLILIAVVGSIVLTAVFSELHNITEQTARNTPYTNFPSTVQTSSNTLTEVGDIQDTWKMAQGWILLIGLIGSPFGAVGLFKHFGIW